MQKVRILKWDAAGQVQLVANAPIAAGEEILRETPLVKVPVGDHALGSHAWDLTQALAADARLRNAYFSWQLRSEDIFPTNREDKERERFLVREYGVPRPMVRKLYVSVATNNIGYGPYDPEVKGHGLYEMLSRANHSCVPSAAMVGVDAVDGELSLVAKDALQPGQEITWNYLGERSNFLKLGFLPRNVLLVHSYGFVCRCSRCRKEVPADLRDVNLLHFFRDFLKAQADKLVDKS